jgi:hypothetical protein
LKSAIFPGKTGHFVASTCFEAADPAPAYRTFRWLLIGLFWPGPIWAMIQTGLRKRKNWLAAVLEAAYNGKA